MGLFLMFCVGSVLELWPDPYYHREYVNFWEWLKRELIEEVTYERE
jgi:hypothetical protein